MTDNPIANIVTKPPIVVMRERLEARVGELKAALVDVDPDRFIRAVITSATINPDIQACSWQSLWLACMRACRDDLLPDGRQGAIVPFKDRASWIPMYQGLLLRAWRTGKFKWIGANVVRTGEEWEHYVDTAGEHFRHVPGDDITWPIIRVYAAATTVDGGNFLAVLPKAEADKIRAVSKATREDSPWRQWESEMYKKTALRRLAKLLPIELTFDEEAEEEPARPVPVETQRRAPSAIATLDAFAGIAEAGAADSPPADPLAVEPPGPPETDEQRTSRQAYQRGKDDKSAGVTRKACPPEYRDTGRLAMAWVRGWSGEQFLAPDEG